MLPVTLPNGRKLFHNRELGLTIEDEEDDDYEVSDYTKITDLEVNPERGQDFYGKVCYIAKKREDERETIVLLKDETASIYLAVTPKKNTEIKFQLRQVVRVCEARVRMRDGIKMAMAAVGKRGCSLVIWPQNGNPYRPVTVTSNDWVKSWEDEDKLDTLSDLDGGKPKVSVEEITAKMKGYRKEWKRITDLGETLLSEKVTEELEWQWPYTAEEVYERRVDAIHEGSVGTRIDSRSLFDYCDYLLVDTASSKTSPVEEVVEFVLICKDCLARRSLVYFTTEVWKPNCQIYKLPYDKFKMAFRVRIFSKTRKLYFHIPISIIEGGKLNDFEKNIVDMFGCEEKKDTMNAYIEQLRQFLLDRYFKTTLTKYKGVVISHQEEENQTEVLIFKVKILKYGEPKTPETRSPSKRMRFAQEDD